MLEDLQKQFNFSYLFIAHDLSVVRHLCHRVAVMYLGKIVELADCDELFDNPQHPYTKALLSAVPVPDPAIEETRAHQILEGEVPSPMSFNDIRHPHPHANPHPNPHPTDPLNATAIDVFAEGGAAVLRQLDVWSMGSMWS